MCWVLGITCLSRDTATKETLRSSGLQNSTSIDGCGQRHSRCHVTMGNVVAAHAVVLLELLTSLC